MYVIDEERIIVNGVYEGILEHEQINHQSIMVYTGKKMTGERIYSVFATKLEEKPNQTLLKVYGPNGNIYITYEVMGEIPIKSEPPKEEPRTIFEGEKVDKMYVDMELEKKADKVKTYTKYEVDNKIRTIELLPGPKGPKGEQGPPGQDGYTPIKGKDYFDGEKGEQGARGEQGIQGMPGKSLEFTWDGAKLGVRIEGEPNYTYVDLKGGKGDQGIQGPQGIQGETGPIGPQGKSIQYTWNETRLGIKIEGDLEYQYIDLQGPIGPQGVQGIQGPEGPQGLKGDIGPQGAKGENGYTPVKGVDYFDGAKGEKGDTGPQGPKGDTGPMGPEGPQGPKGDKGDPITGPFTWKQLFGGD